MNNNDIVTMGKIFRAKAECILLLQYQCRVLGLIPSGTVQLSLDKRGNVTTVNVDEEPTDE